MTKFTVTRIQNAYVVYTTEIEAETPKEAIAIARDRNSKAEWTRRGTYEYGHAEYEITK